MNLADTIRLYGGGPGSGRHKEVADSMLQNFRDGVAEGDHEDSVYDLLDYMKTNYRSNMPEEDYNQAVKLAVAKYKAGK